MKLHEAIEQVLRTKGQPLTTAEIAAELNKNGWYTKKDNSKIDAFQIHGRTRNYSHLFRQEGSKVFLTSSNGAPILKAPKGNVVRKIEVASLEVNPTLAVKMLLNERNFKNVSEFESQVPMNPGLYCIRIKEPKVLPSPFDKHLSQRGHNIIYIGIASQSLYTRLNQELRAMGHGTFFRSIGAVLGYRPEKGSLLHKKNKRNYTFKREDELEIIHWLNRNLLVNWIQVDDQLNLIEKELIEAHLPLLNISKNPLALPELSALRKECQVIANQL